MIEICVGIPRKYCCSAGRLQKPQYRTYDIQGFRDGGVDILIKLHSEATPDIGVDQSYDEMEKWAKGNDKQFIQRLKSQCSDATQGRRVNALYIALCTDAVRHAKQIRMIGSELGSYNRVRILIPQEAIAFYQTPDHELAGRAALSRIARMND